jgi:hypothetical protein
MGNNNLLAGEPFPSTNLAAQRSSLDHESQPHLVQTSDKERGDIRKPPEQRDENPDRKVGE